MTVGELKKLLSRFDQNALVVLSSDSEGNAFSPFQDASEGVYAADTTYSGQFTSHPEDEIEDGVKALCLWSVN